MNIPNDIPQYNTFRSLEPINKGWSDDKKFYIETTDNQKLLLRISDFSAYDNKKMEYDCIRAVAELDIPASRPIDFGICGHGKYVYMLLTWCEGQDAESILPSLSESSQYSLGYRIGEILKRLHTISAPTALDDWSHRFNLKTNKKMETYKSCGISFNGDNKIIDYIEANRGLLNHRPQCYQHGDYHAGNMIISDSDDISIIDFNRPDFGDPWEEFNRIVWSAEVSPQFATGQINGYFDNNPPLDFFKLLAFYIGSNTLSSIYWAIPFGQREIDTMINQSQNVLNWFDAMQNPIPTWYLS